jgi:hypothetical protein
MLPCSMQLDLGMPAYFVGSSTHSLLLSAVSKIQQQQTPRSRSFSQCTIVQASCTDDTAAVLKSAACLVPALQSCCCSMPRVTQPTTWATARREG